MCTMEHIMPNTNKHTPPSSITNPLPMHKHSHLISKTKPKIRIIHIFAPEIIKTDVANFRELVQRLTGKPPEKKKPKKVKESGKRSSFSQVGVVEKIKGEEEIWVGANSGGGFLGGFADLDGFMQEFSQHSHGFAAVIPSLDPPNLVNSHLEYGFGERSLNFPTYS